MTARWFAAGGLCAAIVERRRCAALALGVLGVGALLLPSRVPPRPWLVWNVSESAPVGLYRIGEVRVLASGDMVLAHVPRRFRRLAAERHYIPLNVPLVKRVAAVPGHRVCADRAAIVINGTFVAARSARDGQGRLMPSWNGCVVLGRGVYFLLMDSPASFDGRYFGPTRRADIIGGATPIWLR
jgi:conjugative transfer signal peptidase TraF